MTRSYSERRYNRYVKGMRRVREDRAQHGSNDRCPCLGANGNGAVFAIFADHPKRCSSPGCCGNPRPWYGASYQELRAPTASEWD